jgi:TFIIIC subunit triple barrel domain
LKRTKLRDPSGNDDEQIGNSAQTAKTSIATAGDNANAPAVNEAADDNRAAQDRPEDERGVHVTTAPANDIQILDLHGQNPVISFHNQIYHCTWSDLIGTAMFFTKAEVGNDQDALIITDDFRLITTSRIKLVGQKAKLIGKPGRKRRREPDEDPSHTMPEEIALDDEASLIRGKSLGEIRTSNPKTNADIKRQAAFLERLMDVKRAKGEFDNVRAVFSQSKGNFNIIQPRLDEVGGFRQRQEFSLAAKEIEELNRRVVRGDAAALIRLQDIYSIKEVDAQNSSSQQEPSAAPSQTPDDAHASANVLEQRQSRNT